MEVTTARVNVGNSGLLIQNFGPDDLYVGESDVTSSNGLRLKERQAVSVGWSENPTYIVSAGTSEVRMLARGFSLSSNTDGINSIYLNVRQFGASGNGLTDDTAAFQAAVDAAYDAGGGTVLVPCTGSDYIVSQIQLKKNVRLQGVRSAVIRQKAATDAHLIINAGDTHTNCEVVDIHLHGNKDNQSTANRGIYFVHTTQSTLARHLIRNVGIRSTKGDALYLGNYTRATRVDGVDIYHCDGNGVVLGGADSMISNVDIGQSGLHGVWVAGTQHNITNVKSWYSGRLGGDGDGFLIGWGYNTLVNCFSQENRVHGFQIFRSGQDVPDVQLIGCHSNSDGTTSNAGFHFFRAERAVVIGSVSHTSGLLGQPTYGLNLDATCDNCDIILNVSGTETGLTNGTVPGNNRVVINNVDKRVEKLWIPAQDFAAVNGSPVLSTLGNGTSSTSRQPAFVFDAGSTEVVAAQVQVPQNWATFDVYMWWSNAGGGSGNVQWGGGTTAVETTETTDADTSFNAGTTYTAPAQYVVTRTKMNSSAVACVTNDLLRLNIYRWGAHANDTLANDAGLLSVELVRVS